MKKLLIIAFMLLVFPIVSLAQVSNIGIIQGIWFSADEFFAGDQIRIYTAVQNNSGEDIEGIIEFFDNDISIGQKNFTLLDRRVTEVWMDDIVSEGKHDYSVSITEASINKPGQPAESVTPRIIKSDNTILVDVDTDGDNIGDQEDPDDDNDGVPDTVERSENTDPLDKDSKPVENSDTSSSVKEGSFLDDLLSAIEGDTRTESDTSAPDDVSRIEPAKFIQDFESSYPVVSAVTQPLNDVQNIVVPKINKEKQKTIEKIRPDSPDQKPQGNGLDTDLDALAEFDHGVVGWEFWVLTIYSLILGFVSWIFSCIICMIITLFALLYLVLKFIFNIFGSRLRSIQ